jgi:hypothetical protein
LKHSFPTRRSSDLGLHRLAPFWAQSAHILAHLATRAITSTGDELLGI